MWLASLAFIKEFRSDYVLYIVFTMSIAFNVFGNRESIKGYMYSK